MPSGKSKEDTWKASDLEKSIKGSKDERKHHRDKERDRHRDKDRDKERDKHRDKDRDKERDKHHDRDRDRHRDKDRDKERDRHHDKDRDKEREKRHDKDRERHHDKDRKDKDRHRDGDGKDHERHHRDGEHRDKNRHKDEADGSRRRHRDDREHRSKHHDDKDIDRPHRKRRDEDRGHKDDRHRHKDQVDEKSRKHRSRDEDDKERSRKHQEYKERESREKKERQEEEKKKQDKEEEDFNYEDDFEDYDDDFEDDDYKDDDTNSYESSEYSNKMKKGELDEICEAVNKESDRLLAEYKRTNIPKESEQKPKKTFSSSAPTFINFVSAKQRHINKKAMGKLARRGYELQEMIEFDVADYDIFDMPPVAEYNIYMRNFGSSTAKQAYVQTNEDNIDREIQTEEIEFKVKWTQQPPHEIISSGDPENTRDLSKDIGEPIDMPRLSAFVERASQVMMTLMEEDYMDIMETEHSRSQHSNIIISDAFTNLNIPNFLKDRPVITSHFSAVHTHMLLMLHRTPVKPSSDPLTRQGCICVWNVNNPDQPQQILMCESQPKCCCFSPTKTNLIFSGMQDGCLVCWDTREPSSLHKYHKHNDTNWLLRYPTYNTAGVLHYDNHQSPVVAISTIVAPRESASASLNHKDMDDELSFQLASLEENGTIHLWVVAQLSRSDVAGSESDFGLAPGGRIKLIKSFTIKLESPLRNTELRTTMKCSDIQLLPTNNSHYYVASDTGCVIHGLRYGGKALPRAYRPQTENIVQVTTIDFSPFPEPVFLAGCEDGSLRMYHIDNEWPLLTWLMSTDGRAIRLVRWCRSRPAVFFVVDVSSRLYIWDLLMDDSGPLKHEKISEQHLTSLSLSNDYSATGLGLPGRRPQMVICLESGCCEVHTMSQKFSALMSDELDQFSAFLQKIS